MDGYEAAVQQEVSALERAPGDQVPAQLRVGVKLDAINSLAKRGFTAAIAESLRDNGKVSVLGKEVDLTWSSKIADVSLVPDPSCLSCLKADVKLAGRWEFDLPVTKAASETTGEFSVVAPLKVVSGPDGELIAQLDTSEAVNVGGFKLESELDKLPDKATAPVRERLSGWLESAAKRWVSSVPPIRLFEVQPLSLGEALEIAPTEVAYDLGTNSVFVGLATQSGPSVELGPPTSLGPEDAASMTLAVGLVQTVLASKLRSGELARRYSCRRQA